MVNHNTTPALTNETLKSLAPAIFSTKAATGVKRVYKFFPTTEIIEDLGTLGWYPIRAKQQKRSKMLNAAEGRKALPETTARHLIIFENLDHTQLGSSGERPQILLVNSHDRTASVQLYTGVFRNASGTGLVTGDFTAEPVHIRHMGYSFEYVRTLIHAMVKNFELVAKDIDLMKSTIITDKRSRMQLAMDFIACRYTTLDEQTIKEEFQVPELFVPIRDADGGMDLWTLLNIAQEKIMLGGSHLVRHTLPSRSKEGEERRRIWKHTRSITNIKTGVDINRALWNVATQCMDTPRA